AAIEPDSQHVANLHAMSRRHFAHAIDADMTGLDQRRGAGAGLHHPRVPQPFIETLALQAIPLREWTNYSLELDNFELNRHAHLRPVILRCEPCGALAPLGEPRRMDGPARRPSRRR